MQYRRFKADIFFFCLIFCLLGLRSQPFPLFAQAESELIINRVQTTEHEDGLELELFFRLFNDQGLALSGDEIETASIVLDDGSRYTPIVARAEAPLHVTLLIDTGHNMRGILPDLETGLIDALRQAPSEALFGVTTFHTLATTQLQLTHERVALVNEIKQLESGPAGSCQYDALYATIQGLQAEVGPEPAARRVIVLLTNGPDAMGATGSEPCSTFGREQVIRLAQMEPPVEIYALGLSSADDNIDFTGLTTLTQQTGGRFLNGRIDRVASLLNEVLNGLTHQFVARALIFPQEGTRTFTLNVGSQNGLLGAAANSFFANRSWVVPSTPPVEFRLNGVFYDQAADLYQLQLPLDRPEMIEQLTISVWDEDQGVELDRYHYPVTVDEVDSNGVIDDLLIEVPGKGMLPGKKYALRLSATDLDENQIVNAVGEIDLVVHTVSYAPEERLPLFRIDAQMVEHQSESGQLVLDLINEAGLESEREAIVTYTGRIENRETGITVQNFTLPADPRIVVPLGDLPDGNYRVVLRGFNGENGMVGEAVSEFAYLAPARLSLLRRLGAGLSENLWLLGLAGLAIVGMAGFVVRQRREKRRLTSTPFLSGKLKVETVPNPLFKTTVRPEERQTAHVPPRSIQPESVLIQGKPSLFIQASGGQRVERSIIQLTHLPFTIGRRDCDYNFDAKTISRRHVQFIEHDGDLYIQDLGSSNGTFLNEQRLRPELPYRLENGAELRLGSELMLVFERGLS